MTDPRFADDRELARRILAGDREAFDAFCDLYPGLYRFVARQLGNDPDLVMDIAQSTVTQALDNLSGFRGESTLFTWLCGICRFEIIAHYRRKKRTARQLDIDQLQLDRVDDERLHTAPEESPELRSAQAETAGLVHATLDELPQRYGAVLEWKYCDGLSVKEIAARLELGPKATESLLTRARNAFRERFGRSLDSEEGGAPT